MNRPGPAGGDGLDEARSLVRRLRKPLGVIAGYAAQIEDGTIAGPAGTVEGAVAVIGRQAREALRIVDAIHRSGDDLALPHRPGEVDLAEAVRRAVGRVSVAAHAADATVETDVPDCALPIRADVEDLNRILDNLLDNAVRHCPGPARVRVDVRPGDVMVVAICDRGPGIPAEIQPLLFQPLITRPRLRRRQIGVGLALSGELAERNGAELHLASTGASQGTTFILRWPRLLPWHVPGPEDR